MPLWLMQTIIVLIVLLIGVALFGLIYLVFWLLMRFSPRPVCPKCGNNGLRIIDGVREGRPAPGHTPPASWLVYRCQKCRAVLRLCGKKWEELPQDYVPLLERLAK